MSPTDALALADYRRQIHAMYEMVRSAKQPAAAWHRGSAARAALFATHAQSPLEPEHRAGSAALHYFAYDPGMRITARLEEAQQEPTVVQHSGEGATRFDAIGTVSLGELGIEQLLTVYWLDAYGGGLFLPFRDATSGNTTYGGGRYLLDTVKGADLGSTGRNLTLDFNFSYHPSCVYSARWSCPLAPPANRLNSAIEAGESLPTGLQGS